MDADLLRNAEQAARRRGLDRMLVIDADVHHLRVLRQLPPYMDPVWRLTFERAAVSAIEPAHWGGGLTVNMAGRLKRPPASHHTAPLDDGCPPAGVRALVSDLARIGVDYSVVFPQDLLFDFGWHPQGELEVAAMRAYARWMTERVLPHEPRVLTLLSLPMSDPEACVSLVEEFGGARGVVGFMVTPNRTQRLHDGAYARLYAAIEERGLALGFHGGTSAWGHPWGRFDTYLGAHTLFFPAWTSIQLTQILLSGIPERFPKLRLIFFECGAAWVSLLAARLDTLYLMRPSEAPLLRRRPSAYMREFFYTVQPLEQPESAAQTRALIDRVGRSQILFASDFPHWDFDLPSSLFDLGFLSDAERRDVMAGNAIRALRLDPAALSLHPHKLGATLTGAPATASPRAE
jgi:predicted TIM-barrel fold metal-dependent hydrolase